MEAQNWISLDSAYNEPNQASVLYPDSVTGKLFVGGDLITKDGHQSFEIAAWDGSNWDTTYSFRSFRATIRCEFWGRRNICSFYVHAKNSRERK